LAAAKRLVEQDKVVAIAGPASTAVSASAQEYADQAKIPMVGCICLTGKMTPYTFSTFPLVHQVDQASKVAESKGLTKVAILTQAGSLGDVRRTQDVPAFERNGMTVVGFEQLQPSDTDATALLARMKADGAELFYLAANGGLAATAVKNYKSLGYSGFLWTWAGNANFAFINLVGDAGDVVAVQGLKILVYKDLPDSDTAKAALTAFAKDYVAKTNREPAVYSGVGYDAMLSIGEALKSVGPDSEKIRSALETQKLDGLNGPIARSVNEHNGLTPVWLTLKIDVADKKFAPADQ
jgi:branched-chain amino acid transport system substrate-binding protein